MTSHAQGDPDRPRPRIYLAGPDVFLPDRDRIFAALKADCARLGLAGVAPIDAPLALAASASDDARAQAIYEGNVALIRESDGVVANLASFRGQEPDAGTVFEVGFAVALGLPVVGYGVPQGSYAERVQAAIACRRDAAGEVTEAATGTVVEGLGQPLNLMLSRSIDLAPTAAQALERLAGRLGAAASL
ncbi:nucleoside 2-deoxyribosyltransferase [Variovorax ginsengisoli]|uniref:Nucleoside 2-deoxyribosyltransferase n=1 Tax=Variovorax ginsengisoli TaxID=363844 RepID=A0ABT8S384_9BURK|nr:nucleoside 2-deoxyribosyltransferase [Variovorax ginsengisoli]MDN8613499.1 nucleoside 2-deoxyribosyltransferase [Variovorax ginsengisoli]MDO1532669.1 nucleoside 2-deoxyribosyltransferase [Variovorax ginsengisoli]